MLKMWWWGCLCELLFYCTCWLALCHGQEASTNGGEDGVAKITCNDTKSLDECWNKLPPIKDHGIPSNPQAVNNSCKVFDAGMECVDNWSKACLPKQDQDRWKGSVIGALETYRYLCTDKRFRREFLQHAECYKRISSHWDDCARKFIESLKRVDHARDVLSMCCIRFRYLQCVSDAASHLCNQDATKFLQKMAESLVRSTMRTYHPAQCSNVGHRNCSELKNSAQSSTKFFSMSPTSIFATILYHPTKGIINSLNVLQNLAFSDITTFFCALSRELGQYFSYHHGDLEDESLSSVTTSTNNGVLTESCTTNSRET